MNVAELTRGVLLREGGAWVNTAQEWDTPPGEFEFLSGNDVQVRFDALLETWLKQGRRSVYYVYEDGDLYLAPRY